MRGEEVSVIRPVASRGSRAAVGGKKGEIIAENRPTWEAWAPDSHLTPEIRRCRRCGVRKLLARGFYRERKGRGGYRRVCKKCRNLQRAAWARRRYVPKTGRRYRSRADRAG